MVRTEFYRRRNHLNDVVEQIGVDDGHVRVLCSEILDGVQQQRVVEHHNLVGLLETAGGGVVLRRIGVSESDEDWWRASGWDHPRDNHGLGSMLYHSLLVAIVVMMLY